MEKTDNVTPAQIVFWLIIRFEYRFHVEHACTIFLMLLEHSQTIISLSTGSNKNNPAVPNTP